MFKNTVLFVSCLLLFAACNSTSTSTTQTVDPTENVDPAPQPAVPAASTALPMEGENYKISVVDAKIKSPRKELTGTLAGVPLKINYGSPAVNDRAIFGDLVPFEKVWRTGANEATRITFDDDVMVGEANKKLPAGTYALFTMPSESDEWTVIFNKNADQWGAYDYDEADDALRIKAAAVPIDSKQERMDFILTDNEVMLMWDDRGLMFPVTATGK